MWGRLSPALFFGRYDALLLTRPERSERPERPETEIRTTERLIESRHASRGTNHSRDRRCVGLGGATVDMIVAAGGRAVVLDVNEQVGQARASQHGEVVRFVRTDVTTEADMQRAIEDALSAFGRVDGLVNAAGVAVASVCRKEGRSRFRISCTLSNILIGTFNAIRLAAGAMATNDPSPGGERGVIVNTASVAAFDGQIGQAAYSASRSPTAVRRARTSRPGAGSGSCPCRRRPGRRGRRRPAGWTERHRVIPVRVTRRVE